jgi:hypothetical protein
MQLWQHAAAAAELIGALTAHPQLRQLDVPWNMVPHDADGTQAAAAGAALAALLLANAPALQTLNLDACSLGDEGLGPVLEALRHNTHLTKLDCSGNELSEAFARNTLLPAVRANTSLRLLVATREANALVAARARSL